MIVSYTLSMSDEWDRIVKSFNNYDVYYLSAYVKAFKINGDGEPVLIYFESENTRAINVVMKRDLAECKFFRNHISAGKYFDIATPYGYGGFIVEGTDYDLLNEQYTSYCAENGIVCEFVRFHPIIKNYEYLSKIYDVVHLGKTVCLDLASDEVIFQNMSSKNRNMVRKAQKNGLEVVNCRNEEIIDSFMNIYNATMDKDNATDYYYFEKDFYKSILDDLNENALWFYTKRGTEIAAIAIFLFANGKMHYHLSGSRREFQSLAPVNLLLYEAARWGAENGYKMLHLGGGVGSGEDGLYKFKKSFNRNEDTEFRIGKKIFNKEAYDNFVALRRKCDETFNSDTRFFPTYRG